MTKAIAVGPLPPVIPARGGPGRLEWPVRFVFGGPGGEPLDDELLLPAGPAG